MPTKDRAERLHGQQNGRRGAKDIAKMKTRRRERDRDHELARQYNGGRRDLEEE